MTIRTTLLAGTALALALSGAAAVAQETGPNGEPLSDNQTFTYRVLDEVPSIDPGLVEDVEGSIIARDLFEGLMNQDREGNLVPGVATGYEVSDDGLTYTFTLREDARWSDGKPVTAGDFVYGLRRAASPELASPYQWYVELMAVENVTDVISGDLPPEELGIEAIDDRTLEIRLTEPLPYFPQMVTHTTAFPVPQWAIEEHGDAWTQPGNLVGNGAYVLTERVPQERLVREKNPEYWDAENVIMETVTTLVINDENQALTRYLAGELDQTDVPAGQFPRLSEEYPEQAVSVPELCSYYYNLNVRDSGPEWAQDVNVRKALSLAINRDIIVNNVLGAGQIPAYTFTPGATAGFEIPEVPAATMTQEERTAMAQELMAEAGYGPDNPIELEILYNTSESHRSVAVAISQMWKQALGVEATLANMEWQTFLEERGNGNFEISRAGWCGDYNEASTFLDLMVSTSGYNDAGYVNPEYDELMAEAKTAENPNALYAEAERIVAEDVPIIPIYHYTNVFMLDENIEGWPMDNVQQTVYSRQLYRVADEG